MRGQWRAEEDSWDHRHSKESKHLRRKESTAEIRRRGEADIELRIKGRAIADTLPESSDSARDLGHNPGRPKERGSSTRSPYRGARREEFQHSRDSSQRRRPNDQHKVHHRGLKESYSRHGRRSRSPSPLNPTKKIRDNRRRPVSPLSYRERDTTPNSRHRDRFRSPHRSPRIKDSLPTHHSRDERDTYRRRRSPSPVARERTREFGTKQRRSRSRGRHAGERQRSPAVHRRHSPRLYTGRGEKADSAHQPRTRSRASSRRRGAPRSPSGEAYTKHSRRLRSPSSDQRTIGRSRGLREEMHSSMNNGSRRSSQNRVTSNFDPSHENLSSMNGASFVPRQVRPPHLDTRQSYNASAQWTPTSSHQGSPHSTSPYSQGRGGWQHQQYQGHSSANAFSPSHRHNSYPPQQSPQYYSHGQQSPYGAGMQQNPSYRGSHTSANYRGAHYSQPTDRRFSGPGHAPPSAAYGAPPATRGRGGHFQNLQWTASSASRTRGAAEQSSPEAQQIISDPQFRPQIGDDDDDDNPFRPSKDLQVQDESQKASNTLTTSEDRKNPEAAKDNSKISFTIKAKVAAQASTKPPPDLSHRSKNIVKKEASLETSSHLSNPRDTERENHGRDRHSYRRRDDIRENRRSDLRDDRRADREPRRERPRARTPEPRTERRIVKTMRYSRTLSPESAGSISVYYRKPGNESVVGSGTYGKVFKAIHVYTKELAALKKIRMDGEKDGFPVTAVREIKLLQSLKHDNVVCLQEVMVENNDCFMVFEYLSHDLTGLLNHPTFKLDQAHKKHLSKQLFEGLNYLHRKGVLHRDIKAANILVSGDGQLKLADFGLARFYSKRGKLDYTNRVITIWYRSPELLLGETQYGPAVDIWSAACVMVEIFTRHAIFPGDGGEINQLDKIYNVLGTPTRTEWPGLVDMAWFELLRPTERRANTFSEKYKERVTPSAFELLEAMFQYDPNLRPSAGDVLEHPYFTVEEPAPQQAIEYDSPSLIPVETIH